MLAASTLHDLGESAKLRCSCDELRQIVIVQRIGFAHIAARIELIKPDLARRRAFLKKQHDGFDACALERAAGAIQHGVQVAAFQQQLAQADRSVVRIRQKRVFDDDAAASARAQNLDEMLQEQKRRLARADGEVLLHFLALFAAEGRIGEHDVVAVFFLNVGDVFGQRVGVDDVRRFDAVQDHVHDRNDIGQRLFLFAVKGAGLAAFPDRLVVSSGFVFR